MSAKGRDHRPSWRATLTNRPLVVHYLRTCAAMTAGMVVLEPLSMRVIDDIRPPAGTVVMASSMVAGMVVWMAHRRHRWRAIIEMSAAMYGSLLVLFALYWLGALSATELMLPAHMLMLASMAAAMLHRREEYLTLLTNAPTTATSR